MNRVYIFFVFIVLNVKNKIESNYPSNTFLSIADQSKKDGKDQESIQSSTRPDPRYQWESDNITSRDKRSALSQQVTTRHQQTDVHESITKQYRNNIKDPQKKHRLGTVSKTILLEGLNRFNGAPTSPSVQMRIKTHRCPITQTQSVFLSRYWFSFVMTWLRL